jgi:hypothetical protein
VTERRSIDPAKLDHACRQHTQQGDGGEADPLSQLDQ